MAACDTNDTNDTDDTDDTGDAAHPVPSVEDVTTTEPVMLIATG